MAPKVKIKHKINKSLETMQQNVKNNTDKLWLPKNIIFNKQDTQTWFDKHLSNINNDNYIPVNTGAVVPKIKGKNLYKSKTVNLRLTNNKQKEILINWLNAFRIMYNYTIKYIVDNLDKKDIDKLKFLNTKISKSEKQNVNSKNKNKQLKIKLQKLNTKLKKLYVKKKTKSVESKRINQIKESVTEIHNIKKLIKTQNISINNINNILILSKKIQNTVRNKINNILNYKRIRTYVLKEIRDDIQKKSNRNNIDDLSVYIHILDTSIKKACANYKTCVTNYLENNCKSFRIKYWRRNKKTLMMEIESSYIKKNQIAPSKLGTMKYYYDGEEYKLPSKTTINVYYNSKNNEFTVGIPEKVNRTKTIKEKTISIDQGMKTYVTGITENNAIKYGSNMIKKLMPYIKKIRKIKENKEISEKRKRGIEKKNIVKIQNLIDEAQWKIINEITDSYKTVIIGNLSTKNITNNGKSEMTPEMKDLAYKLRFYEFRERMKYKCISKGVNYKVINESYTSKVCTHCSNYNKNLKNERIYECIKCDTVIDRDLNGARNILLKAIN